MLLLNYLKYFSEKLNLENWSFYRGKTPEEIIHVNCILRYVNAVSGRVQVRRPYGFHPEHVEIELNAVRFISVEIEVFQKRHDSGRSSDNGNQK